MNKRKTDLISNNKVNINQLRIEDIAKNSDQKPRQTIQNIKVNDETIENKDHYVESSSVSQRSSNVDDENSFITNSQYSSNQQSSSQSEQQEGVLDDSQKNDEIPQNKKDNIRETFGGSGGKTNLFESMNNIDIDLRKRRNTQTDIQKQISLQQQQQKQKSHKKLQKQEAKIDSTQENFSVKYQIFNNFLKHGQIEPIDLIVQNVQQFIQKEAKDTTKINDMRIAFDKYNDQKYVQYQTNKTKIQLWPDPALKSQKTITRANIQFSSFRQSFDHMQMNQNNKEIVKQQTEKQIKKIIVEEQKLDQEQYFNRLEGDKCELCKNNNGQNLLEIIKFNNQFYFINKSFIHNNQKGSLAFQVIEYNFAQEDNNNQDKINVHAQKYINYGANIKCLDPSFIQIYQREKYFYYFEVNSDNNTITLRKYNLLKKETFEIQKYDIDTGTQDKSHHLEAISVFICQQDNFFQQKHYEYKRGHSEADFIESMIICIIQKQINNKVLISFRQLKQPTKELISLPLNIDFTNQISIPQLLSQGYLDKQITKQGLKFEVNSEHIVIPYLLNNQEYKKILTFNRNANQQLLSQNTSFENIINISEYTESNILNNLSDISLVDEKYPKTLNELSDITNYQQNVATLLLQETELKHYTHRYYVFSEDYNHKPYRQVQHSAYIHRNILEIINQIHKQQKDNFKNINHIIQKEMLTKMIMAIDYLSQKVIILLNFNKPSDYNKKYFVIELNIPKIHLRYDLHSCVGKDKKDIGHQLITPRIVQKGDDLSELIMNYYDNKAEPSNVKCLMVSHQYKNVIRDEEDVFIFFDKGLTQTTSGHQHLNKQYKIADPQMEINQLTGHVVILSKDNKEQQSQKPSQEDQLSVSIYTKTGHGEITPIYIWNSKNDKKDSQLLYKLDKKEGMKEIYIEKEDKAEDDMFVELSSIPVKFTTEKSPEPDENTKKERYRYYLINQSMLFKEDDRGEQPFLLVQLNENKITNIWFVLVDLNNSNISILKSQIININQIEMLQINSIKDIKVCASSSITKQSQKFISLTKLTFEQTFQVCIYFKKMLRFKIWEYQLTWNTSLQRVGKSLNGGKYKIEMNQISQKEFIAQQNSSQLLQHIEHYNLLPLLDNKLNCFGTQIVLFYIYKKKTMNLYYTFPTFIKNSLKRDHTFKNKFTHSGYKIYNLGLDNQFTLVDVKLSGLIMDKLDWFNQFEKEQLLHNQLRIVLNMVPFRFINWILRAKNDQDLEDYDHLQSLEILHGRSLSEFSLQDPIAIQNCLSGEQQKTENFNLKLRSKFVEQKLRHHCQNAFGSFLEQIFSYDPPSSNRKNLFEKIGLYREKYEVSDNIFQINLLELCLWNQEWQQLESAGIILNYMFLPSDRQTQCDRYKFSIMKILSYMNEIVEDGKKIDQMQQFFGSVKGKDIIQQCLKKVCINYQTKINNTKLPKISLQPFNLEYINLDSNIKLDINNVITSKIIEQGKNKKYNQEQSQTYEIEHSFIDLRYCQFQDKLIKFRENSEDQSIKSITFSDFELSQQIEGIQEMFNNDIDSMQVIKDIIDHQFKITKQHHFLELLIYIFLFLVPLIIQIELHSTNKYYIVVCNIICLITHISYFLFEIIKSWNVKKSIFTFSKICSMLLIPTYWFYFSLRVFHEGYRGSFLLVREFEYEDGHQEIEMIIDMLQNMQNITYVQNDLETTEEANMLKDYKSGHTDPKIMFMTLLNAFIIVLAFLHLIQLLKIFHIFVQLMGFTYQFVTDLSPFMFLFFGWIIFFSIMFQILGVEIFKDDYVEIPKLAAYILYTYRNSVGDIFPPIYTHWASAIETTPIEAYTMITVIWICWLINQWINLIILLNVLIALISNAYDQLLIDQNILNYQDHSRMNREATSFKKRFRSQNQVSCLLISQSVQETTSTSQQIMLNTIKGLIKSEHQTLREELIKRDESNEKFKKQIQGKFRTLEDGIKEANKNIMETKEQQEKIMTQIDYIYQMHQGSKANPKKSK